MHLSPIQNISVANVNGDDFAYTSYIDGDTATLSVFETVGDIDVRTTHTDGTITVVSFSPTVQQAEQMLAAAKTGKIWAAKMKEKIAQGIAVPAE